MELHSVEINLRWNLIRKVEEQQNCVHMHTPALEDYEAALFKVACNLKHIQGRLLRLGAEWWWTVK